MDRRQGKFRNVLTDASRRRRHQRNFAKDRHSLRGPSHSRFDGQIVQSPCMPKKDFRGVFFARQFSRNSASINVAHALVFGTAARTRAPRRPRRHKRAVRKTSSALRWLRGEASVVRFDLPQAQSFATAFCRTCGSPMPHVTRSGREAIVPAGGFDEPLGAAPDRHAQWSSRADWYVHGLLAED
jgi:Glutathione-dependent formaldehyde-activating enzyme